MPLQKLQFRPGVNREGTTLANEGGWFECDKIRFRSGYPEKLGGWTLDSGTTPSTLQPPAGSYWGVARSLWNWLNFAGYNLLSIGTSLKFYIQNSVDGFFWDVTPIRSTTAAGDVTFAATTASSIITVTDLANGAQVNDFVTFSGAVSLGGNITDAVLNAEFQIKQVVDANTYKIDAGVAANSSDVGDGGSATVGQYQLTTGNDILVAATGWGAGGWSGVSGTTITTALNGSINSTATTITVNTTAGFPASGTLLIASELITYASKNSTQFQSCVRGVNGTVNVSHSSGTIVEDAAAFTGWGQAATNTVGQQLRLWSQANYGEDLIFNPRGGAMYYWANNANPNVFDRGVIMKAGTTVNGAVMDSTTPSVANCVMVSDASRFVIAFGTNDPSGVLFDAVQDPMLVRWSQQEQFYTWTPSATNQAGDYRLSRGSEIVATQQTRQEILVFTDVAVYSMQYLGAPYVWGFQIMGDNISIAGPNVTTAVNNVTYWMGADKFYMYSGRVETLPCDLRQYVYDDINMAQSYQFFSGTNEGYNEVWWFYCSSTSDEVNRYVVFNYLERIWYYGNLKRTAWLDTPLRDFPIAATAQSQILYHEDGNDDGATVPGSFVPFDAYVQSSDFDIGDGHNFGLVTRIIPDVTFDGSNAVAPKVQFTVRPRQNPGANYGTSDSPNVVSANNYAGQRTYNVQQFTQYVYVRVRGRQMAFKVGSTTADGLGVAWQLGAPRLDVRPDGRR